MNAEACLLPSLRVGTTELNFFCNLPKLNPLDEVLAACSVWLQFADYSDSRADLAEDLLYSEAQTLMRQAREHLQSPAERRLVLETVVPQLNRIALPRSLVALMAPKFKAELKESRYAL